MRASGSSTARSTIIRSTSTDRPCCSSQAARLEGRPGREESSVLGTSGLRHYRSSACATPPAGHRPGRSSGRELPRPGHDRRRGPGPALPARALGHPSRRSRLCKLTRRPPAQSGQPQRRQHLTRSECRIRAGPHQDTEKQAAGDAPRHNHLPLPDSHCRNLLLVFQFTYKVSAGSRRAGGVADGGLRAGPAKALEVMSCRLSDTLRLPPLLLPP
jgi:hypothetical protein